MTIRKYFLISFIVLCFVFSNSLICASEKPETVTAPSTTVQLTDSEQAWLQQNPIIKVANQMDWPPFDYNEIGVPKGFSIDYIKLLAGQLKDHPKFESFLDDETIELLYKSAPLHDIGKVAIEDSILLKQGKLTNEEFEAIKKHTIIGRDAIRAAVKKLGYNSFLRYAEEIAYTHQEKWDGSRLSTGFET